MVNAVNSGDLSIIEQSINILGAEAASDKGFGPTAVATTVFSGNVDAVKLVHDKLAVDINAVGSVGNTPLMWAALWGQDSVVSYLLSAGADKTIKNKEGKTAEMLAREGGHRSTVRLIRDA